jgi:putative peptide zinc metalloprotease protein
VVVFGIAIFVAAEYWFLGVALGVWSVTLSLIWPIIKSLRFVVTSPSLGPKRVRAVLVTAAGAAALGALVFAVPLPRGTVATGMIEPPDGAEIIAEADGVVAETTANGAALAPGDPIARLEDPFLASEAALAGARLDELRQRLRSAVTQDRVATEQLKRQVSVAEQDLADVARRRAALTIAASTSGTLAFPRSDDAIGGFVRRGDVLGYVLDGRSPSIKVLVPAEDFPLVVDATRAIAVRRQGDPWTDTAVAGILRERPTATRTLPHPAFSNLADGPFALDPSGDGLRTLFPFFVLDLPAPDGFEALWRERVMVRFDHPPATLGERAFRAVRQLFLDRFNV